MDEFPSIPFTVDMSEAFYGDEEDERLNRAEYEVRKNILVVQDALNGSKGFRVGWFLGIQGTGFTKISDLHQEIGDQIRQMEKGFGKRIAVRLSMVESPGSRFKKAVFSLFTDSRELEEHLQSFGSTSSPLKFRNKSVWFGTFSEALDMADSSFQRDEDVEQRKVMIWGLKTQHGTNDLKRAIIEVMGNDPGIWAEVRSGRKSGPFGVAIFPTVADMEVFFRELGNGDLWVGDTPTNPRKSKPQLETVRTTTRPNDTSMQGPRNEESAAGIGMNSVEELKGMLEQESIQRTQEMKYIKDQLELLQQTSGETNEMLREVKMDVGKMIEDLSIISEASKTFSAMMRRLEMAAQALRLLRDEYVRDQRLISGTDEELGNMGDINQDSVQGGKRDREKDGAEDSSKGGAKAQKEDVHVQKINSALEVNAQEMAEARLLREKLAGLAGRVEQSLDQMQVESQDPSQKK